jgi:predicted ATPase
MSAIIKFIDDYLTKTGRTSIDPVEANALLAKAGILRDSKDRPGKPLRDLLRKGQLPHAFQAGGKGSSWAIPHSSKGKSSISNYSSIKQQTKKATTAKPIKTSEMATDISRLKKQLETARQKYKPETVKYLLVAEAPPDSLERFFYYDSVRQHDYLFLGVAEALYPKLKEQFLLSRRSSEIKNSILQTLQKDGFYLLDLSELPLSFLDTDLQSQLPSLVEKINSVSDDNTQIILIKANVYDIAFYYLKQKFENVIDQRITFPGQGGQRKFQDEFKQALKKVHYYD